jgi:hypothetical protein
MQVFYKFATAGGLYPDDAAAAKAAARELSAMNAVIQANQELVEASPEVLVPFAALHHICGHCVVAIAAVPIDRSTLQYGCDNAGTLDRVVCKHEGPIPKIIQKLSRALGLAEHAVRVSDGQQETLCLPIDAEVHLGRDGNLYAVDLARLMPPVPVTRDGPQNAHMYHHFRPEFLRLHQGEKWFADGLSSDAFSNFEIGNDGADRGKMPCRVRTVRVKLVMTCRAHRVRSEESLRCLA